MSVRKAHGGVVEGLKIDGIVGPITWRALVSGMLAG
jgi:hypothetical protein